METKSQANKLAFCESEGGGQFMRTVLSVNKEHAVTMGLSKQKKKLNQITG